MSKSLIEEFKLPILTSKNLHYTNSNLINELELVSSKTNTDPVFKNLFNPKTEHGKTIMKEYSKYYTTMRSKYPPVEFTREFTRLLRMTCVVSGFFTGFL